MRLSQGFLAPEWPGRVALAVVNEAEVVITFDALRIELNALAASVIASSISPSRSARPQG